MRIGSGIKRERYQKACRMNGGIEPECLLASVAPRGFDILRTAFWFWPTECNSVLDEKEVYCCCESTVDLDEKATW